MAAPDAPHFQFQNNPKSRTRQVANMPQPSIVPPLLNPSATAANRFFERRSSRTTRTCESPNTPRTLAAARKPANEYPSDSRGRRFFDLAIPQHAEIERTSNLKKALIHKLIWRYGPLKSPTRLPEDPIFFACDPQKNQAAADGHYHQPHLKPWAKSPEEAAWIPLPKPSEVEYEIFFACDR